MRINRDELQGKAYIGIDVNLTGLALATIRYETISLDFIDIIRQEHKLDDMFVEWHRATQALYQTVEPRVYLGDDDEKDVLICIEDPTGMEQKAWQTAAVLNRLIGMMSVVFIDKGFKCMYPSSVMWKKRILGNPKAQKKEIQEAMGNLLFPGAREPIANHHQADALALAMYGYFEENPPELPKDPFYPEV